MGHDEGLKMTFTDEFTKQCFDELINSGFSQEEATRFVSVQDFGQDYWFSDAVQITIKNRKEWRDKKANEKLPLAKVPIKQAVNYKTEKKPFVDFTRRSIERQTALIKAVDLNVGKNVSATEVLSDADLFYDWISMRTTNDNRFV
jgi:hypothetical protein